MSELETVFKEVCGRYETLSIVRVGANDGTTGDHFWPVIKAHPDWRVLYLEPHPQAFERLLKNVRGPNALCLNIAISDKVEERTFWEVRLPSDNPEFHHDMLSSFHRHVVMKAGVGFEPHETQVKCCPLSDALDVWGNSDPDVYLIDTEGYDYEIMKQIANRPLLVVWEFHHLSDDDQEAAIKMWRDRGYEIQITQFDVAAIRNQT